MAATMLAGVLHEVGRMEVRELPRPRVGAREVLVRVEAVGLCGTDFHIFSGEGNYNLDPRGRPVPLARSPQVLGHEIVGRVEELGGQVHDLEVGRRVVLDQGLNCSSRAREPRCSYCADGDSHQCEDYAELGITGLLGGLAELVAIPAVNALPVAPELDAERAALTEPLGCVLHALDAVDRAGTRFRLGASESGRRVETVLVCGAGPAGLLFVQVLRRTLGFEGRLVVSDPDGTKRELARSFGAEVVDPAAGDLTGALAEATEGRGAELVIEASGSGPLWHELPGLLAKQATLLLYGHGHGGASLETLNAVQWREPCMVSPIGASGGFDADGRPAVYRRALEAIEDGVIDVAPLVTHRFRGLEEALMAFGGVWREPGYVKGVVLL